jgi:hypothetical protein
MVQNFESMMKHLSSIFNKQCPDAEVVNKTSLIVKNMLYFEGSVLCLIFLLIIIYNALQ